MPEPKLYGEWGVSPMSLLAVVTLAATSLFFREKRSGILNAIRVLCLLQLGAFAALSAQANFAQWPSPSEAFLSERALAPLDGRPCCIRSGPAPKAPGGKVAPLPFPRQARNLDDAVAMTRSAILGGMLRSPHRIAKLVSERRLDATHAYAHYTFQIGLFRFVDDVELLFDSQKRTIAFRSHLRVGQGDMGANHDRMAALRAALLVL
ncbi:hypothetical protein T492DRAFT_1032705 [Pavlovales sp. CCMP2436]|nr:hypothetical protein T492DRAFT_1032705 [Pavlovales sp. CCMP2436]|mmetsp:Transcript_14495/g.36802  ORF Transcript_14495/g.36802 Transcript_14495/m.36802 type:complete len:207 (-) Transcript_14495:27-647(-)